MSDWVIFFKGFIGSNFLKLERSLCSEIFESKTNFSIIVELFFFLVWIVYIRTGGGGGGGSFFPPFVFLHCTYFYLLCELWTAWFDFWPPYVYEYQTLLGLVIYIIYSIQSSSNLMALSVLHFLLSTQVCVIFLLKEKLHCIFHDLRPVFPVYHLSMS